MTVKEASEKFGIPEKEIKKEKMFIYIAPALLWLYES